MKKNEFEALKGTKFLLFQSEMVDRSEDKYFATSSLGACNTCLEGLALKHVQLLQYDNRENLLTSFSIC